MKRLLLVAGLFACLCLGSCQCSNPPPVGPIEGGGQAVLVVPALAARA